MREEHIIAKIPDRLRPVYAAMRDCAQSLGPEIVIAATTKNITFRARWVFAEIHPKKTCLRVLIRPDDLRIAEGACESVHGVVVKRVPDSHKWHVPFWIDVDHDTPIDGLTTLLRRSYESVLRATK